MFSFWNRQLLIGSSGTSLFLGINAAKSGSELNFLIYKGKFQGKFSNGQW